jgi:hypothetical protein
MFELNLCSGTLILQDDIAVECTDSECEEWSLDRHELVLSAEEITPATPSRQFRAAG